jgi:integrase
MAKAVAAAVPRFTEHDLRACRAGESTTLAEAQQRLGHASPEVTLRVYQRMPEKVAPLR